MTYTSLHDPGTVHPTLSVAVALSSARKILARYEATNIHDHGATVQAAAALETSLRSLIAAVDAEAGERA